MDTVKIGKIVNTHGLQGELKLVPQTHFITERFHSGALIWIQCGNEWIEAKIRRMRQDQGLVYIVLEGLEHINEVERFKGCDVFVKKEQLHELDADEVYYFDLMDCEVYTTQGVYVGVVEDVLETGANAVLRVRREADSVLIPYVRAIVASADVADKRIVIEEMEGLL